MKKQLENKVAVITGATSGMALATAKLFAEEGAYVFIMGRRKKELDEAVIAIGKNVTGVQGDVSNLSDLDHLYDVVKKEKGYIDIVYASAGYFEFGLPLGTITEEQLNKHFDVNVKGTLFTVQKALPMLRESSSVIMTGTAATALIVEGMSLYSASKSTLLAFARTWSIELKSRKIRFNVISPGPIKTAIYDPMPEEILNNIAGGVPFGRIGAPEEIAHTALFLASDNSSFITGMDIFVDGGFSLNIKQF
jgi:NAD(P)-dependent dehydrogenase (short-subunit alcohol dehydrogenase family)